MTYQNNNNRVTPKEVTDRTLQPQASPVDKTIKYQPNVESISSAKATADALAKLGQGVMDVDFVAREKAMETAIELNSQTLVEGNKAEWSNVSKNIKGMAKFNPYVKDSYMYLTAQNLERAATIKLFTPPDMEKMSEEQFNKHISDTRKEFYTALNESGIKPRMYSGFAENLETEINKVSQSYTIKNSEYNYNNRNIAKGNDLAFTMAASTSGLKNSAAKAQTLKNAFNKTIKESLADGVYPEDIAKNVLFSGLGTYIVNNAESLDSVALMGALKDLTIDGKPIEDIVPNYSFLVQKAIKEARRASYEDRKVAFDEEQLTLTINNSKASKDLFKWMVDNPNASIEEGNKAAYALIAKYGLEEDGFKFLGGLNSSRHLISGLKEVNTDPEVMRQLSIDLAAGELSGDGIAKAVGRKQINYKDGNYLYTQLDKENKQISSEYKAEVKLINNTYLKKDSVIGKELGKPTQDRIAKAVLEVQNSDLPEQEKLNTLKRIKKQIPTIIEDNKSQSKNARVILNGTYRSKQVVENANKVEATETFRKMGILRNSHGVPDRNIQPVSFVGKGRTVKLSDGTTKTTNHFGTDASTFIGRKVYPPKAGEVLDAGYEPTMGNYVLLQCGDKFVIYMHLQPSGLPAKGTIFGRNDVIGYVGNTGSVENKQVGTLHVEFWNSMRRVVSPERW